MKTRCSDCVRAESLILIASKMIPFDFAPNASEKELTYYPPTFLLPWGGIRLLWTSW